MEEILQQILSELKEVKKEAKLNNEKIDNLSLELRSGFKHIDERFDDTKRTFEVVADEFKTIKDNVDFLSKQGGKHSMDINSIMNRFRS